jgi:hypothetical protein
MVLLIMDKIREELQELQDGVIGLQVSTLEHAR